MSRPFKVRFGGENFGFAVPSQLGEGSTTETESVLANYFPELTLKMAAKTSRGSRLGRSAPAVTREAKFVPAVVQTGTQPQPAAPTGAAPSPTQAAPAPTPAPAPAPEVRQPVQEAPKAPAQTPEQQQIQGYYQQYMGRTPAAKEIADWQGTGKTMAEIESGLKGHSTSIQGTADIGSYYQAYLGRPASAQEVKDWQGTGYGLEAIKENLMEIGKRKAGA